ncbi:type IV pilus secretin PilQ [Alcanivorax jadensis]|jgi:type IV pilus assembly protein PilQ|uniref:type IV pilus secretin PilQ n=1 Tax=Alcanivorax jadensis TaxID=64988 RepID=UPI002356C508|nr:type IV pilus secretin PilQ [Alcanivorax jadensis]MDF1639132.1 type IV pilus secretin PilQ [Alcanivorax jadensis]|tara:strand:+ start:9274 stop:11421 length:2148 start_codon:yes stop_codon:yes gene_type:complete
MMINIDFKTKNGMSRRVTGFFLSVLLFGALSSAQASTLKSVQANALSGDSLEVRLTFSGAVPEVKGYGIEKPARIALDLIGADSVVDEKRQNMGAGNVRSVTIVEAKDRTRLIFNLDSLAGYSTNVDGDTLVVLIGDNLPAGSGGVGTASDVVADAEAAVTGVDFRRGDDGEGRVLVKLSQASIPVDVQESGDKIVARFVGAGVSDELVRKLDVTDFATPVKLVETKALDGSTTIEIQSSGAWEYLAYQADELFSINVKPVSNDAAERKKQDAFEYTGEKLSLNFQDIEVRSVLQLIADFTGLNLVASDTVDGRITLRLQNVPWDQALELILKTKGLDKRKVGNVLLVAPADEIAAREQLELESQKQIASLAPLRTQYVNVNYANAAEIKTLISGADKEVGSLLSERGSVVVDKRTNTLIIQDTQARLNDIGDLIEQLDIPVQQVLIEARVVVASNDVSKEFGVRWGGLGYDGSQLANEGETSMFSGRLTSLRQLHYANIDRDDDGSLGEIEEFNVDTNNDLIVDLGVESSEASRFAVGFTSLASGLIELELSALEAEGHGELVATPKVLTADQQPAVIAAGQRVPYETATSSGATAVKFIDAELRLEVTPHITPDDNIIMTLKVFNDAISGFVADTPVVDTNRVETSVLVSDGETVVLGGIFQQEKRNSVAKTPFLGDLPWIGKLFSRTTKVDDKQELLIFITPRLMKDALANR